jgi:hypothetical protein
VFSGGIEVSIEDLGRGGVGIAYSLSHVSRVKLPMASVGEADVSVESLRIEHVIHGIISIVGIWLFERARLDIIALAASDFGGIPT